MKEQRDSEDTNGAVPEHEGRSAAENVLNNARVVRFGRGFKPLGISQQAAIRVLQVGPSGQTRTETQSAPFSATSCWTDAPPYKPLHSWAVFVPCKTCWVMPQCQ